MSTLKVTSIQNPSTSSGGVSIDTSGHVTVDGVVMPNAGPLSNRNKIINGDMRIDQRNAGGSITQNTSGQYPVDRFYVTGSVTSKFTAQQNAGSVTPPAGFTNYLGCTSSSAYSIGAGDFFIVTQLLEGFNVADFDFGKSTAKTITLSFWVRSSLTGTFGGAVQNGAGNRSYPFSYAISATNTWEQKSVTIAGDTSGTWNTDNSSGMVLRFGLGVGSTYSGTAGSWSGSQLFSATGATSVVGTNGATFYITGVQLEVGSVATPFEHRGYGDELARCLRYFQYFTTDTSSAVYLGMGIAAGSTSARMFMPISVPMRTTPSITENGASADDQLGEYPLSSPQVIASTASTVRVQFTASSMTGGRPLQLLVGAGQSITLSAEL